MLNDNKFYLSMNSSLLSFYKVSNILHNSCKFYLVSKQTNSEIKRAIKFTLSTYSKIEKRIAVKIFIQLKVQHFN
jgi:hypothetical protein